MRIGTLIFTWDECPRCHHFDEDHGCNLPGQPEIMADDATNSIVCLTGQKSEADDEIDIDLQEPWE